MAAAAAGLAPAPSSLLARLQQAAAAVASSSADSASGGGKLRPWDGWGLPGRGGQQSGSSSASKLPGGLEVWGCMASCVFVGRASLHGVAPTDNIRVKRYNLFLPSWIGPSRACPTQVCCGRRPPNQPPGPPSVHANDLPADSFAPSPQPGVLWEVSAELASLGVSLVGPTREMAYLRASGVRGQLAGTAAHLVVDLELRTLQVRGCCYTVLVHAPVTAGQPQPLPIGAVCCLYSTSWC